MLARTRAPAVRPFGFHPLPAGETEHLKNGVTLHSLAGGNHGIGQVTVLFPGGRFDLENRVLSAVATSLYTEGAGSFSGADIADILDFAGARFAPHTSAHYTGFSAIVLGHRLPDILPVLEAMATAPHFADSDIENIRRMMLSKLKVEETKVMYHASAALRRLIYGCGHPLASTDKEAELEAVDRSALGDFQRRLVKPRGTHIYLSGGFGESATDALKRFAAGMSALDPDAAAIERRSPLMAPEAPQTVFKEMPDAVQTAVCAGMPAVGRRHPHFIPLRLAVMALGGYFGSRLMTNIREEKGLTYHIDAALSAIDDASATVVQAQCNSETVEEVVGEIRKEMASLRDNPPSGAELDRLKLFATSSLIETLDSPISISNYRQLETVTGTPTDYFEAQQRAIASLTPEIISEMASLYLRPEELRVSIAGPKV